MRRAMFALALLGFSACGGKVVFVEGDDDNDGAGGSSSSIPSQGGSSSSTSPPPMTTGPEPSGGASVAVVSCETFDCAVGQTFCSCIGECSVCFGDTCSGGEAEQVCNVDAQGMACQCFLGGDLVGECSQVSADCGLETGCCLAMFQGALQ